MANLPNSIITAFKTSINTYNHQDTTGDEMRSMFDELHEVLDRLSGEIETTVNDTTKELVQTHYHSKLTTAHASSVGSIGDGHTIGQRKLISATAGTGGDEFALDAGNVLNAAGTQATSITFTDGQYLLLEWDGTKWDEVHGTATIGTA